MKNTIMAITAAGLMIFGAASQAGDATAGQAAYGTCIGCHGAAGEGGVGPKLAGADPASTVAKLKKYKAGEQVGPMTSMMAPMAMGLSESDMENIAAYVAGL